MRVVQPGAYWPPHQGSWAGGGFIFLFPNLNSLHVLEEGAEGGTGSGLEATQKTHFPGWLSGQE